MYLPNTTTVLFRALSEFCYKVHVKFLPDKQERGSLTRCIQPNERGNGKHIATDYIMLVLYTLITDHEAKCIMHINEVDTQWNWHKFHIYAHTNASTEGRERRISNKVDGYRVDEIGFYALTCNCVLSGLSIWLHWLCHKESIVSVWSLISYSS